MFRELRKEKGFTQVELAEKLYVSQNTISNWETGWCTYGCKNR